MVLPCASVIVVLLKLAFTCATPETMFLRSRRRTRPSRCCGVAAGASLLITDPLRAAGRSALWRYLFAGDRASLALARARIGVGALTPHRQIFTMTEPAIAAEILQPLDVELHLAAKIALDLIFAVDHLADLRNFLVGELAHAPLGRDFERGHDVLGALLADAVDVLQPDLNPFSGRKIDACDSRHVRTPIAARGPLSSPIPARKAGIPMRKSDARPSGRGPASSNIRLDGVYLGNRTPSVNLPPKRALVAPARCPPRPCRRPACRPWPKASPSAGNNPIGGLFVSGNWRPAA